MAKRSMAYTELSRASIQQNRNAVISKNESVGGYTIAQQMIIDEGTQQMRIFLKGAIHVEGLEGLYHLRDAINRAINIEEREANPPIPARKKV